VDRPPVPPWQAFDDFRAHAGVPRWSGSAFTLVFFALVPAFWAWKRHSDAEPNQGLTRAIAAVAVAVVVGGLFWAAWDRYGRERYLRRVHRRALAHGIAVHAYPTSFRMDDSGNSHGHRTKPTILLVDARLPEATARRLHGAFEAWCDRLAADPAATAQAREAVWYRRMVALSEIFGPEATGAWLSEIPSDMRGDRSPWRLLLLDPKHVEVSEVLSLGDGPAPAATDPA